MISGRESPAVDDNCAGALPARTAQR